MSGLRMLGEERPAWSIKRGDGIGKSMDPRRGFTLFEILLAMVLTVVVAGLVGTLIQVFLVNQTSGRDQVKQAQLARAVLSMIAEDIRTTVRHQPFDSSGLSQILGGGNAGGAATGSTGGATGPATASSTSPSGSSASSSSAGGTSMTSTTNSTTIPPGIYGSETSIEIDVSRLPRPDEYYPTGTDLSTGALGDLPSDIKTVAYFVQAPREDGIQDPLSGYQRIDGGSNAYAGSAGLVRRSVDRAITQNAYQQGLTDSLLRTGELVAPEVVAIEFQYFDGATWQLQWDSSVQGLPKVVKVTIAIQRESKFETTPYEPGGTIASLTSATMQEFGIDIFSMNTIIPGSHLLSSPTTTDSGMSSMGISGGTQ